MADFLQDYPLELAAVAASLQLLTDQDCVGVAQVSAPHAAAIKAGPLDLGLLLSCEKSLHHLANCSLIGFVKSNSDRLI